MIIVIFGLVAGVWCLVDTGRRIIIDHDNKHNHGDGGGGLACGVSSTHVGSLAVASPLDEEEGERAAGAGELWGTAVSTKWICGRCSEQRRNSCER